jgi:hypothetical protein
VSALNPWGRRFPRIQGGHGHRLSAVEKNRPNNPDGKKSGCAALRGSPRPFPCGSRPHPGGDKATRVSPRGPETPAGRPGRSPELHGKTSRERERGRGTPLSPSEDQVAPTDGQPEDDASSEWRWLGSTRKILRRLIGRVATFHAARLPRDGAVHVAVPQPPRRSSSPPLVSAAAFLRINSVVIFTRGAESRFAPCVPYELFAVLSKGGCHVKYDRLDAGVCRFGEPASDRLQHVTG